MGTKKKIIVALASIIILVLLCVICIFAYRYWNSVNIYDEIEILKEADEYIMSFYEDASIIEHSEIVTRSEYGVAAVLVGYEIDDEYRVDCVYFVRDRYFSNIYHIEGAQGTVDGEIVADSQYIKSQMIIFVRGMHIPKEITSFKIPALGYEAEIQNHIYLDIIIPASTQYEIEISE